MRLAKRIKVSIVLVVLAIVVTLVVFSGVRISFRSHEARANSSPNVTEENIAQGNGEWLNRVTIPSDGVVCYTLISGAGAGISCLPDTYIKH